MGAVDCAPYVHAKLQAVHHEHGPAGRYIIADRPRRTTSHRDLNHVGPGSDPLRFGHRA